MRLRADLPHPMTKSIFSEIKGILSNKAFVTLWINQILVQVSYNMLNFSLIILVFRLTGSNTITATFLLMVMIPSIVFGVFAGVVADRFDKRKILLLTDIGIALVMLLFIPVYSSAFLILVVAFILNIIFQFFIPAEAAALPSIVHRDNLLAANALFQFTPTAALIIGSASAGPIVSHFGYIPIFLFGSGTMLATFFIRRFLPAMPAEKHMAYGGEKEGLVGLIVLTKKHTQEGLRFILSNNKVWAAIFVLSFIQATASTVAALGPGFMEQILKIEATDASLILLLPTGIGLLAGAAMTIKFGQRTPHRFIVTRGFIICGSALIALALTPVVGANLSHREFLVSTLRPFSKAFTVSIWVSFFALFVGFGLAQVIIPAQTSLQTSTPSYLRGRVFAVWAILIAVGVSIPALVAGAIADIFGVVTSMIIVGAVVVVVGLTGLKAESFTAHLIPRLLGKIIGR